MHNFKFLPFLLLFSLIINSCSSSFLKIENISRFNNEIRNEHSIIFFRKTININNEKELTEQNHFIFKIGANLNSAPDFLYVYDNSVLELIDFEARIIKTNGEINTYSNSDLITYNLSSKRIIQESSLKYLEAFKLLSTGDLVEVFYSHRNTLPSLGFEFSLDELGVPSRNISLIISAPEEYKLDYKTINGFPGPKISINEKLKRFEFNVEAYESDENDFIFGKKNKPAILISIPDKTNKIFSWKDFGNWYLNLIGSRLKADAEIVKLAEEVTKECSSSKEKADAIFNFCQKDIRYEQVYLSKGEFIPNDCKIILSRKYADCKDYSALIYTMGKSVGINFNLAMCCRGRGFEFYKDIPVSQFNHMIVYYSEEGQDYWYDGTNRKGISGLTTPDLINQQALVLERDNSRIIKIKDSEENLLKISGTLKPKSKNLSGRLKIELHKQYAIDFFYLDIHLNRADMGEYISKWIKKYLSESILLKSINWKPDEELFLIEIDCEIPNSLLKIKDDYYTSMSRIFPELFLSVDIRDQEVFYYPSYYKLEVDLKLEGLKKQNIDPYCRLKFDCSIQPGPFENEEEKISFLNNFKEINEWFNSKVKLIEGN